MIKIWLDDERKPPRDMGYVWIKHADDCIELLNSGEVSDISLDHDLGEGEMTGYDIVKFMETILFDKSMVPRICRIHSQNPVGAKNMKLALDSMKKRAEEIGGAMLIVLYEPYNS